MPLQALIPCYNCFATYVVFDLVRARRKPIPVIFHLGHLGHGSWCPEGIDAPQGFNLTEKVLAPYMLEAKLYAVTGTSIDRRRASIEKRGDQEHVVDVVVVAADD
jgi:hypothetical protein